MLKAFLPYWPIINVVASFLAVWAAWSLQQMAKNQIDTAVKELRGKDSDLAKTVDGLDTEIIKLVGRMGEVEDDIDKLPTRADLARVEGEVKTVGREVAAANNALGRIEGFMIQRGLERT